MKIHRLALALAAAPSLALHPQEVAPHLAIGETAAHDFRMPPLNALGVESLDDLRGKPVLVAYWGHDSWADDWVEDVLRLQREHGDDLAVLLVDMQGASMETIESTAFRKGWIGGRALWSNEHVAWGGGVGFPQYSLLACDGKLLKTAMTGLVGMNFVNKDIEELEDAVAAQVRVGREGPPDALPEVARLWKDFSGGKAAQALADARRLAAEAPERSPLRAQAESALAALRRRVEGRIGRAECLLEAGRYGEVEAEHTGLAGELDGEPELAERCAAIEAALRSPDTAAERTAAEELDDVLAEIADKGLKKPYRRALEKLVKKRAGTRAAARAARYLAFAEEG
jgi:hypothetical protein